MKHLVFLALLCASFSALGQPLFQVPDGFIIRPVAAPPAISFPMFAALDNQGRLYVTESSGNDLYAELLDQVRKCRVSLLEDGDGDGAFEKATVFAENLTPSMGLVWRDGKLYVADPPDLVSLEDTDGDGQADKRTVILTGFGHTDNGSLHGLTFGPDGWLYFTTGNPDGYELHGPDGSYAHGRAGALLRCRPDGSGVETLSRGFENLVEIVFLPDGSIIGTDTWYQLPEGGIRDALVHLLEGGQYPIHAVDSSVAHLQFNTVIPPVALFPAVAHSGLEIYHGSAFPAEMRGNLFSAQHNTRKIVRHVLSAKGSSYACDTLDFVTTEDPDVHFSDVLQDRDGSLLIVDTGSWYVQHCPTGRIRQAPARGGIYRVSFEHSLGKSTIVAGAPGTNWVADLASTNITVAAAAARMLGRLHDTDAAPKVVKLLRSESPALQLAAAEAIAHCGDEHSLAPLEAVLAGETDAFLEHALIFAMHELATAAALTTALDHPSPKVQRAALLLLDQAPYQAIQASAVVARLNSPFPPLRDTARWVLLRHREWGEAGVAFLRTILEEPQPNQADRQALVQFLPGFATNVSVMAAIVDSLAIKNHSVNDEQRAQLLEAVAMLDLPKVPGPLAAAIIQCLGEQPFVVVSSAVRAAEALRLPGAEEALAVLVRDPVRGPALRLQAMRALARRQPLLASDQFRFLLDQLTVTNLPTVRLASVEVLARSKLSSSQTQVVLQAVRGDPIISPGSILELVGRNGFEPDCALAVIDYLEAGLKAGWTVSPEQLAKVQAAVPESQRSTAETLIARLSQGVARQRQQLTEFALLLTGGDYVRGEKVFFEKGQCISCHRIWENGGRVGPDLTKLGAIRSGRDILESLLIPSASIAQGYETLNVFTKDGESYSGVRVGHEDSPLRLRFASGSDMVLQPSQIERIDRSKLSLMPEGLLNTMTSEEVRDLLAFLQHLR